VSERAEPTLIVAADAATVGRRVRRNLDAGRPAAGFVGGFEENKELVTEFAEDVVLYGHDPTR
jgi:hypothetical protein